MVTVGRLAVVAVGAIMTCIHERSGQRDSRTGVRYLGGFSAAFDPLMIPVPEHGTAAGISAVAGLVIGAP